MNKEQKRAYHRAWRAAHIEQVRAHQRAYYHRDPEKGKAKRAQWAKDNREYMRFYQKQYMKAYNAEHREEINAKKRHKYATDPVYRQQNIAASRAAAAKRKDEILAYKKNYRRLHKQEIEAYRKQWIADWEVAHPGQTYRGKK